MEYHEVANIFPLMQGEEFDSLKQDIARNGLQEPIWTYNGQIIDGRNRYRACQEVGINPRFREWDGKGPLVAFVLSMNLHRRHLTSSQASACALEALPLLEKEAKGRQAHGQTAPGKTLVEIFPQAFGDKSRDQAAELFGTNAHYVSDMKKVKDVAPELVEEVKAGKLNVSEAKQVSTFDAEARQGIVEDVRAGVKPREAIRRARRKEYEENRKAMDLPNGKYEVIYADPPWDYEYSKSDSRNLDNQYPTMSLEDICQLPIADLSAEDSVLLLWTTSPKLEESLQVVSAWGFQYRTCMVWVKDKIGMGYYARQQHEILLIGKRGNLPVPEPENRHSSVVNAPRTKHSRKPMEFYEVIEAMYPGRTKVELFARSTREGWKAWGNEVENT